ncbi:hypothetical protein J6590_054531 [Homalodisca vitripennis]|nr:hypothetical protein J6590_054531 [Homalodisca vitripennis]
MWSVVCRRGIRGSSPDYVFADERYDEAHQKMWSVVCSRGIRGSSPDYVVSSLQTRDTRKRTRRCGQ